ncbi:hypothetical protein BDR06DRAFT_189252 [Suillus hirtellus]|nr:hypothetical protein BDR06DRAFT_189252 [Suillus hirtellus]
MLKMPPVKEIERHPRVLLSVFIESIISNFTNFQASSPTPFPNDMPQWTKLVAEKRQRQLKSNPQEWLVSPPLDSARRPLHHQELHSRKRGRLPRRCCQHVSWIHKGKEVQEERWI